MASLLRETPPTRLHLSVVTPAGQVYRWGLDEPAPENIPGGLSFSTAAVGGHETLDVTLQRRVGQSYGDLAVLSDIRVIGPGGEVVWQGRLEGLPRAMGDTSSVTPTVRGYQFSLEDDQTAVGMYKNRALSDWQPMSMTRRLAILNTGTIDVIQDGAVQPDEVSGTPSIRLTANGRWTTGIRSELWFDAGPNGKISTVGFDYIARNLGATYIGRVLGKSADDGTGGDFTGTDLVVGATSSGTSTTTITPACRYVFFQLALTTANTTTDGDRDLTFSNVFATGNQGIGEVGIYGPKVVASDVIADVVDRYAPALDFTNGGSIARTAFVLPHFSFREPTTAAEMIREANKYELYDWAVWGTTFWYQPRGAGREWRARIRPSQLQETGPQIDRMWNGVIVRYNDPDGSSRTVGPTGSGANHIDDSLLDADELSPANQVGIRRWQVIDMGIMSTQAAATLVGQRFMEETKALDTSGQAQLVGWVEDVSGALFPSWQVRGGDTIRFMDAADTSPRRIVKTNYDHDSRTCSVDLDAPPEGLDELLQRLQVVLVPLGL